MNNPKRVDSTAVSKNKWGYRGVEWHEKLQKFHAVIWPEMTRTRLGFFDTAAEAAIAYDKAARKIYGDDAYLNFPEDGEKKVKQSQLQEGFCPKGHSMEEHGRQNSRGDWTCKKCNALAAKRCYNNKLAMRNATTKEGT